MALTSCGLQKQKLTPTVMNFSNTVLPSILYTHCECTVVTSCMWYHYSQRLVLCFSKAACYEQKRKQFVRLWMLMSKHYPITLINFPPLPPWRDLTPQKKTILHWGWPNTYSDEVAFIIPCTQVLSWSVRIGKKFVIYYSNTLNYIIRHTLNFWKPWGP